MKENVFYVLILCDLLKVSPLVRWHSSVVLLCCRGLWFTTAIFDHVVYVYISYRIVQSRKYAIGIHEPFKFSYKKQCIISFVVRINVSRL